MTNLETFKSSDYFGRSKFFETWKTYETDEVDDIIYSPQDVGGFGNYEEYFFIAAEQETPFPNNTIWNEDFFFEMSEPVERWLSWLKK